MRKHLFFAALAVIGAMLSSCQREKDITNDTYAVNPDEVALVLGGIDTRSAELNAPVKTFTYDLGVHESGEHFTLEETVTELGPIVEDAATRGTPAYTQNVTDVHGNVFNGEIYGASSRVAADGPFEILTLSGGRKAWRRALGFDAWKKANGDVTFTLHMPSTPNGVTNIAGAYNGSITFDYETPDAAADQQDILFASRNLDYDTYVSERINQGGAQVLFRHALTGVKFATAYDNTGTIQTFIKKVEISGLATKGSATFAPQGTETVADDPAEFSSANSFTWVADATSTDKVFTQAFTEDQIVTFASGDAVNAPDSFYAGGQNNNLNAEDASLTFWFMPQAVTDELKVKVTLYLHDTTKSADLANSDEITLELEMGKVINAQTAATNKSWNAGQLRTFTLKPGVVDVEIEDKVSGFEKTDVVIRNTGNVDAYIRAMIVANWWGTAGAETGIAMGFTSAAHTAYVKMWERTSLTGDNYGGVFDTLPGADWVLAQDGYFYYTKKVASGDPTGSPLFKKYSMDTQAHPVPEIWYLDGSMKQYTNVYLRMEIPVQAIEAKAEFADYKAAWADAGVTVEL